MRQSTSVTPKDDSWFRAGNEEVPLAVRVVSGEVTSITLNDLGPRAPRTNAEQMVAQQLHEYLAGTRTSFDLPIAMRGTPFEMLVWNALLNIPYGGTETYGGLARRIGKPFAARAVGAANGRNPIPIVVPCHRVVAAGGKLGGYGGGLALKRRLLALEGATSFHLSDLG